MTTEGLPLLVGDERVVTAGPVAHGGHVIAHTDGRTVFVRHALPGESVKVRVTEVNKRIVRADAVTILSPSPDRVDAPCRWSRPGGCGGCDFQHVSLPAQLALKTQVLRESLTRFGRVGAHFDVEGIVVEKLPGFDDGLKWRSRMRWGVTEDRRLGLRRHRSNRIVPVDGCLLAEPGLDVADLGLAPKSTTEVIAARGSSGEVAVGPGRVRQEVAGRQWRVAASSFWQVHPALATTLQEVVLDFGAPQPGESWWDLYCGAGMLAAGIGGRVGESGSVDGVELAHDSIREARRALHDLPQVHLHTSDVSPWLMGRTGVVDGVVLDPPRAGAGATVVSAICAAGPPVIIYVACDPVALGRDVALFAERGYRLDRVRAFDAFPMTHHFETIARLIRVE